MYKISKPQQKPNRRVISIGTVFFFLTLFLFLFMGVPAHAQSDYYIRQAKEYLRDAEDCNKRADSYDREVEYLQKQARDYLRDAEDYRYRKKYDKAKTCIRYAYESLDKARNRILKSKEERDKAIIRMKQSQEAMDKAKRGLK